jgi:SH3-like domain-containing protein
MLKVIAKICSSLFLICAFITPGFADEHFPFLAEVSRESVNVRAGPNTNFEKVDRLNKGTEVVVLGRNYEWFKVQPLATTKAYIRSDYLKIKEGAGVAVVLGDNVNIRCKASSDAASLGEVKKGTLVKVLERAQAWCLLSPVAGTAVWINQDFLKEISSDVPASMLIPALQASETPRKIIVQLITLKGTLQALPHAPDADVHYRIVIDDKTSFYLKDIPQISFFANTVVNVEGTIIPDPHSHTEYSLRSQKKFMYPLLHINKIALVL